MSVPYVGEVLNGWTKKYIVNIITQTVVNSKTVNTPLADTEMWLNKQPLKVERVNKKPKEQRSWKWWSLNVQKGPELSIDDILSIEGIQFKVMSKGDWIESGFRKYEVVEDFQ